MSDALLPARFLFRFAATCLKREPLFAAAGAKLGERYRLPSFAELEGRPAAAEVRAGWNEEGLALAFRVTGKQQPPWCRATRPDDSDGVQLWIDTRDVHNVHRAGRYCHRFIALPAGAGRMLNEPMAELLPINRAREQPHPVDPRQIVLHSELRSDGYHLEIAIPAAALTGFDPRQYPRLGFTYAVLDRELGEQTFGVGSPMPYQEDPSLWATLELVDR